MLSDACESCVLAQLDSTSMVVQLTPIVSFPSASFSATHVLAALMSRSVFPLHSTKVRMPNKWKLKMISLIEDVESLILLSNNPLLNQGESANRQHVSCEEVIR